jgi:hypothetical protein
VVASPYSSKRSSSLFLFVGCVLLAITAGCSTVQPQDKEYLAEPAMTWGDESVAQAHERHVIENREGSFGAGTNKGGGCGCN